MVFIDIVSSEIVYGELPGGGTGSAAGFSVEGSLAFFSFFFYLSLIFFSFWSAKDIIAVLLAGTPDKLSIILVIL